MEAAAASTEIWVLGWSVVLLLVQIVLQASVLGDLTPAYLLSPRDEERKTNSVLAERLKRALHNVLETYPAYIALVVGLVATGKTGGIAATGALLWIVCRVIYVVLYATGVPVARTLIWLGSIVGLVLMLIRLMV